MVIELEGMATLRQLECLGHHCTNRSRYSKHLEFAVEAEGTLMIARMIQKRVGAFQDLGAIKGM